MEGDVETIVEAQHFRVNIIRSRGVIVIGQDDGIQDTQVIELGPEQVSQLTRGLKKAKGLIEAGG
jgi:hypothetical protein